MELKISAPNDKQKEFLLARAKHIGYGGARGGGKSWAVRTKAKLLALRYAGIRLLIVRKSYPELINNHINILRRELLGIAKYNDKEKIFKFCNGSTLNFTYCERDKDLDRMQGVEYDVIFIDEATQLSEHQMKVISACVRGVNDFPKRIYYTCNPGGQGHSYIKRIFIDRKYLPGENSEDYVFIQALVTDNKALMRSQPDYKKQLEGLPSKLQRAWLHGDWNVFEGQFFEEFADNPQHYDDRIKTHVINPFEIPDDWMIYRSFDWGYNKPFSCGWWAVDFDGVVYRILELYGCTENANEGVKWTPDEVFSEIQRIEREHRWLRGKKIFGVADPSIWDAQKGKSISDVASDYGVFFTPGDNARISGWMQVHFRLSFDENGFPMMYVFSNCKAFIRTIPLLEYDSIKPEDLDTDGEDHVADEVRYFLMSRPIKPKAKGVKDEYAESPLNLFFDIPKEMLSVPKRRSSIQIVSKGDD